MRSRNITHGIAILLASILLSSCSVMQNVLQIGFGFIVFVIIEMGLIISALVTRLEEK